MEGKIGELLRTRLLSALDHDTFDVDIFMAGEPSEVVYRVAPDENSEAAIADADTANVTERTAVQSFQITVSISLQTTTIQMTKAKAVSDTAQRAQALLPATDLQVSVRE